MTKELNPKDVELFLLDNLDFFESRESLVGEMKFKHSSSSASSILERQIFKHTLQVSIKGMFFVWPFYKAIFLYGYLV